MPSYETRSGGARDRYQAANHRLKPVRPYAARSSTAVILSGPPAPRAASISSRHFSFSGWFGRRPPPKAAQGLLVKAQRPAHFVDPALVFRDRAEAVPVQQISAAVAHAGYQQFVAQAS